MEKATFAGGCFWGVEDAFIGLDGVLDTRVGYTGGNVPNPSHEDVRAGRTGHVEAVEVSFDPARISYEELLDVFWDCHDPTQLNRQGPDLGTAYRSVIFYHSPEQCETAQRSRAVLTKMKRFRNAIVTELEPAGPFYPAAEEHQHFLAKERARNRPWTPPISESQAGARGHRTK